MKHWLERRLIPKVGAAAIRLLGLTIRLRVHDPHGFTLQNDRPAIIFAFWHQSLFLTPYFQNRLMHHRRLAAMISRSRDGSLITSIISEFGMVAARGSSSKRGSAALIGLRDWLRGNIDVAITPDGPRGPRQVLQPGVLHLARVTGSKIIPLRMEYSHKWELGGWDCFQIPWPFARCDFHFCTPISVPADATDHDLERFASELTRELGN